MAFLHGDFGADVFAPNRTASNVPPRAGTRFLFEETVPVDYRTFGGEIVQVGVLRHTASDTAELMSVISDNQVNANHPDYAEDSAFHGRPDIRCFADFEREAFGKWPRGMEMFDALKAKINPDDLPRPATIRRRHEWSEDAGEEASVDRWRQGEPYWLASKRRRVFGSQVVTVMIDTGASMDRESESITWRSIAGAVLVEMMEDAGYRVEVRCFDFSQYPFQDPAAPRFGIIDWPVKRSGEPLDVQSLVNVASGWFFRIGVFASKHANPRVPSEGLGSVVELGSFGDLKSRLAGKPVFVVENCFSLTSAKKQIASILSNFAAQTGVE